MGILKNTEIIYIGNQWFTENKTSSHHIAEILSQNNRILYIEASGQRPPSASKRDIKKILKKMMHAWRFPVEIRKNIYLYSPMIIPFHKFKIVRRINDIMLCAMLNRARRSVDFKNPLLWILLPHYASVIGRLNEKGVIYYCVDEYSAQPGVDKEAIVEMEKYVLEHADVVFTVSEKLLENKRRFNPNTYLSPHGVDIEHFRKALSESFEVPDDIAYIKKPIVGFFGLIQKRVDLKLIGYLAKKRPDVSFVLIGLVAQDTSMLEGLKNVHLLGARPYELLPHYLRAFNVATLPYCLNDEMLNANPKKTREYLAAGKPVVSVRIREVEKYRDLVYIADGYEEFLRYIDLALKEKDMEGKSADRVKAMEKESWHYRVTQVCNNLRRHIAIC